MHHHIPDGILLKSCGFSSFSKKYIIVEKNIVPVTKNIDNIHNSLIDDFNVYPNTFKILLIKN